MHHHKGQNSFFQTYTVFHEFQGCQVPADLSEGFVCMKKQHPSSSWLMQNKREISKQKVFISYENVVMACFPKDLRKRWAYFGQVLTENMK